MIKVRVLEENNYKGIFVNGVTSRFALDTTKPISELSHPEFYDIKITDRCGGNCPYCYMDSTISKDHAKDIINKIYRYFGSMNKNQRPFQVALGGGEPTLHPDFIKALIAFNDLGIVPNYTTNGQFIMKDNTERILEATKKFCGGVAISCHPHLKVYWQRAASLYHLSGIKLNFHLIISDKQSVNYFTNIFSRWENFVDYFVLLPYSSVGRGPEKNIEWEYLLSKLPKDKDKIAFGANFYDRLKDSPIKVSLYEPDSMSKYLDLTTMKLYPNSFNTN